jgi:C-terminal, D2-small domain, of ClpB protein
VGSGCKTSEQARKLCSKYFNPEFVNRIDEILVMNTLSPADIQRIAYIQLDRVIKLLQQRDISITFSTKLVEMVARLGYDPQYGVRPLKRLIQSQILNPLATLILENKIAKHASIHVCTGVDEKEDVQKYSSALFERLHVVKAAAGDSDSAIETERAHSSSSSSSSSIVTDLINKELGANKDATEGATSPDSANSIDSPASSASSAPQEEILFFRQQATVVAARAN